ncbi:hypothetical protein RB195_024358 [Necator americanus]|uniref:Uncharacterized protein n=1 Tax=Necator americanus TaxID=51031 RepID=A0ABR1ENN1_NECAM
MQLAFLHFEAAFDSPLLNVLRDEVPRKFVSSFGVILVPSGYPLIDLEYANDVVTFAESTSACCQPCIEAGCSLRTTSTLR